MKIALWNSRTGRKEEFEPLRPDRVRMYVCGPTVYDRAHIGNARPAVVFDLLFKLLRHCFGEAQVVYVRNITDIDDKINNRARELADGSGDSLRATIRRVTDETIGWFHEDMGALGVMLPTHEPRATDYVSEMIEMIKALIAAGHAYVADGHVLFDTPSYPQYGSLSRRSLKDMQAGARVEVAPYKANELDFVLWKPSDSTLPGWDSPWGRGRPGWHIECSAMSLKLLGESFDIHGGGSDLLFPHHENEAAQSFCAHPDASFARLWMHNGMVRVNGQKMSKSLGNFLTVSELLDRGMAGETMRFILLGTHYRQQLDWTARRVEEARSVLGEWRRITRDVAADDAGCHRDVLDMLADDLNTPGAMSALHRLAAQGCSAELAASAKFMGLLNSALPDGLAGRVSEILKVRDQMRSCRNFAVSDTIRDSLQDAGIVVQDTAGRSKCHFEPMGRYDGQLAKVEKVLEELEVMAASEARGG
ncbi:MAG: cysteine--tRNA ligase [Rhodobacteraceae bacterium]|nr:cysteine--tRNA ligase [Paracoccaceae bacterium]